MSTNGVRDPQDGYSPSDLRMDTNPATDPTIREAMDSLEAEGRMDNLDGYKRELLDGFRNFVSGIGDPARDKTLGGAEGVTFVVNLVTGAAARDRWRGSDLGHRIIETIPNEMTRRGWKFQIQPELNDPTLAPEAKPTPAREDEWPTELPAAKKPPGELPKMADDGAGIIEALELKQRQLKAKDRIREALCFERAYGGGAVLIGVDDGGMELSTPLDPARVKSIKHLTAYRGGWDGELIAWRYYNDPRLPNFGEPEIYMLRNLGVPISSPPAPGERVAMKPIPAGPTGSLIFYVHESRLLVFPGQPPDRFARVQMRGWADSIFTRVDEVLSQFGQTWNGISILMQEYSLPVMSMDGLAGLLASKNKAQQGVVQARVLAMQIAMSVARMRLIDTKEKLERLSVPLSGVGEVLSQFSLRLAAAAGMPVSMLMGQVQGGLGDASKGDIRFFYDSIEGLQDDRLKPQVDRLVKLILLSKEGPTKGKEPSRWSVTMNPIWQMSDTEKATYRKTIAEADGIYITQSVATPEEVAATRFGGSEYNDGPIVIDIEGRKKMAQAAKKQPAPAAPAAPAPGEKKPPELGAPGTPPSAPPAPEKTDAGDWDETKHPRGKGGQFGAGAGGGKSEPKEHPEHRAAAERAVAESQKIAAAHPTKIPKGATPEQVKQAVDFIRPHQEHLVDNLTQLNSVVTKGSVVTGRSKEVGSALEKTVRKPDEYPDVSKLQDATGMRVMAKDIASVRENVANIKANYKVISEENAIDTPKGDYRSYHMTVETKTGQVAEIQIRTPGQHEFAEWAHNVYKPTTEAQVKALSNPAMKAEVQAYSKAISTHIFEKDIGKPTGAVPKPSPAVKAAFGEVKR